MTLVWDSAVTGKVNQERTATLNFMDDDVSAIYIDWGDGASTKKPKLTTNGYNLQSQYHQLP